MKVHGSNTGELNQVQDKKSAKIDASKLTRSKISRTSDAEEAGDVKTNISSRAKEMAQAFTEAKAAPDVRDERIAELKAKIAEGKYKIDADSIADRMVDEHLQASGIS